MFEVLERFPKQLAFEPEIAHGEKLRTYEEYIAMGMGGSRLPADMLEVINPGLPLFIHNTYGVPRQPDAWLKNALFVAISHSGNTEETLDFAKSAHEKGYALAVITCGGKLLAFARENGIPHIVIPEANLQPRYALGYLTVALAKLVDAKLLEALRQLSSLVQPAHMEEEGETIARALTSKIPLIYASAQNEGLAHIWKISINEDAKVPAFYNVFPELNHNELAGFDVKGETERFAEQCIAVLLEDEADDERIRKRFSVTKELYAKKGVQTISVPLRGGVAGEKVFNAVLLSHVVSFFLAEQYGIDPLSTALIEDFKKIMGIGYP